MGREDCPDEGTDRSIQRIPPPTNGSTKKFSTLRQNIVGGFANRGSGFSLQTPGERGAGVPADQANFPLKIAIFKPTVTSAPGGMLQHCLPQNRPPPQGRKCPTPPPSLPAQSTNWGGGVTVLERSLKGKLKCPRGIQDGGESAGQISSQWWTRSNRNHSTQS